MEKVMSGKLDSGHTYKDFGNYYRYGIVDGPLYDEQLGSTKFVASFHHKDFKNDALEENFCDLWVIHLKDFTYFAILLNNDESLVADLWDLPKMAVHSRLHGQALEILRNLGTIQWSKS